MIVGVRHYDAGFGPKSGLVEDLEAVAANQKLGGCVRSRWCSLIWSRYAVDVVPVRKAAHDELDAVEDDDLVLEPLDHLPNARLPRHVVRLGDEVDLVNEEDALVGLTFTTAASTEGLTRWSTNLSFGLALLVGARPVVSKASIELPTAGTAATAARSSAARP